MGATEKQILIIIPENVQFSDLKLTLSNEGAVSFCWWPIEEICKANGIDAAIFKDAPEQVVSNFIQGWYNSHILNGGTPDPVCESFIFEVFAEKRAGMAASLPPGRA